MTRATSRIKSGGVGLEGESATCAACWRLAWVVSGTSSTSVASVILGCGTSHLHLVRIAADVVAPEIARGVAAGVGGGDQRLADVAGGHAAQSPARSRSRVTWTVG